MRAAVIFVVVDQHVLDRLGCADRVGAAAEKIALDDVLAIGALTPGADGAAAHLADAGEGGQAGRRIIGARRRDRNALAWRIKDFGNAHARTFRRFALDRIATYGPPCGFGNLSFTTVGYAPFPPPSAYDNVVT